ncbi:MAG: 16S rRNA (adenine(1518)-N(6)/adenine(1519)-N(6))-dimethyltransferase RsmA [Flammeovirgaceae bacterium]|nr:MAG: 16S rRNA (adenine(1518)-N(6)/adenine(1519)-N(6))-dimethyltransferase RsmA [Flammeovirgaceae bacterium]
MQQRVKPKKFLGQHFLHDQRTAVRIVQSLRVGARPEAVLEIGPGMGVLTRYLMQLHAVNLKVVELDRDSVAYLRGHFPELEVIEGDFLELALNKIFAGPFSIIGNFPYNISSQIFFSILTYRNQVKQVVCMLQKEVAERIAAPHGSRTYGILSVLLQTFYQVEFLFKVSPGVFNPPPKVMSAVIRLIRNERSTLPCNEDFFFQVVKQAFNTRRKTLRNALKNLTLAAQLQDARLATFWDKRAEQLSPDDFIELTTLMQRGRGNNPAL